MPSQIIGRYQIEKQLGEGGMAVVYLAYDPNFDRRVVLKVIKREYSALPEFRARFNREAKVIARLEHEAIVPVHDFGEDDGQPYIVMRQMIGGSLADLLDKGRLPLPEAARIIERIADALDYAHVQGIIHRDLKPGNILFDGRGKAYLSDFGIAKSIEAATKLTGTGAVGTPAYMSPEQVQAVKDLDRRSDVYSLGVMAFELLTGELPFKAWDAVGLMFAHVSRPIPDIRKYNPDLPRESEGVIKRALAKKPDDRYQTTGDLAEALSKIATKPSVRPRFAWNAAPPVQKDTPPRPKTPPGDLKPTIQPDEEAKTQAYILPKRTSRIGPNVWLLTAGIMTACTLMILIGGITVMPNLFPTRPPQFVLATETALPFLATGVLEVTNTPMAPEFAPTEPVAGINGTPIALVLGVNYTPTPIAIEIQFFPEEEYRHGEESYNLGFYETALADFQRAAVVNPDNYAAHYYMGLIHLERKNYSAAFNAFSAALRISSNFAPALLGRGQSTFGAGGNPMPDYNRAKTVAPNWIDPYVQTAIFYASRRDPNGAISELETAQQLAPDNVVMMWNLAEQYIMVGRNEDARALLIRGFEIDPTVLDLYRVDTKLALVDGEHQKALDQINIYLSYVPTNPNGWTLQGESYLGLSMPTEAKDALTRAIDLKPNDPRDAYIARGTANLALDDLEAANDDFRQALTLGLTTNIRLRIGQAYYNDGVYELAVDQFRRAVTADTTLFDTHYWLGSALVATGEYEEAVEELGKALSKADTDLRRFDVYYERAKAYDLLDMHEEAVRDLREARALDITGRDQQREDAWLILLRLGG